MVAEVFADAVREAERLIAEAPHARTETDHREGLDYLAGLIRASIGSAWSHDPQFPYFIRSATPYTKVGLDNPDTLYFSARISGDAEYVVTGRRGTTADLSFQVLGGDYTPSGAPASQAAFDDRDLDVAADGRFTVRLGPGLSGRNTVALEPTASMLLVREVWSDWSAVPGSIRIQRADRVGAAPAPPRPQLAAKRWAAAARTLTGQVRTFLAFPQWYYLNLPVNTMTAPRLTPGGLATQYSSVGHYDLPPDRALIVTVPASDAPYQGFQLGGPWYVSLDFVNHQTSLNTSQARPDPDGLLRFVVGEQDPGVANWLETTGHRRGYLQIRWQRVSRALTAADGPTVEQVAFTEIPARLPYAEQARVTPGEWRARIAARQAAVGDRMLG
ncbi:MAG: hypothetical protein EPN43_01985 [Jatrophihabitans sp.]|nr:MAG: hypothetical protein EPN43_01985 [Jatrophihabitans sp.]